MKILNWNVEWPTEPRWALIKNIIIRIKPDIICLTEAHANQCFGGYKWIESHPDYGYGEHPSKRKVILGSTDQWREVSTGEHLDIPTGRFIGGRTHGIEVLGLCIPWQNSNVSTGKKDRRPWQDHLHYLNGIKDEVQNRYRIVLGDFNQRIPRKLQPKDCYASLMDVFKGFQIPTQWPDLETLDGKQHIDHIALGVGFEIVGASSLSRYENDTELSDHEGIVLYFNFDIDHE